MLFPFSFHVSIPVLPSIDKHSYRNAGHCGLPLSFLLFFSCCCVSAHGLDLSRGRVDRLTANALLAAFVGPADSLKRIGLQINLITSEAKPPSRDSGREQAVGQWNASEGGAG